MIQGLAYVIFSKKLADVLRVEERLKFLYYDITKVNESLIRIYTMNITLILSFTACTMMLHCFHSYLYFF